MNTGYIESVNTVRCPGQNVRDQGLRRPKMRSLLVVNEQFSDEHNADIGDYGQTLNICCSNEYKSKY